ncbi:MAG: Ldh family oxidoreductase, partial [Thermomicrobia bacterium]|nr:Ldh family oxidoreductase [Thermomicrobia bacterium]
MPGSATEERARIAVDALEDFYVRAFSRAGLPHEDAETTARILMGADVHGIESHGAPLAHSYIRRLRNGAINPHPKIRVVSEFPGTLTLDGDGGIGPVVATYAMRQAIEKARENGVSTVTVRNSNHFAATCNYPLMAAAAGLAGMAMTTTSPSVIPTFGALPLLGTNPIAIAFPGGNAEKPFLIDMSTSVVASGKVGVHRREGKPLPEGWSYDAEMRPTTDPQAARYLNPLGGDRAHGSQKGYGLNVTVDLFCGLLSGGRYSK